MPARGRGCGGGAASVQGAASPGEGDILIPLQRCADAPPALARGTTQQAAHEAQRGKTRAEKTVIKLHKILLLNISLPGHWTFAGDTLSKN
jgi:hypothetical protein